MSRIILLLFLLMFIVTGCCEHQRYDQPYIDSTVDLLKTLQTANVATAPMNPLALPIGAGLAGVIALLESLRRVEKGKRQYAEHTLNNNNNNNSHS